MLRLERKAIQIVMTVVRLQRLCALNASRFLYDAGKARANETEPQAVNYASLAAWGLWIDHGAPQ